MDIVNRSRELGKTKGNVLLGFGLSRAATKAAMGQVMESGYPTQAHAARQTSKAPPSQEKRRRGKIGSEVSNACSRDMVSGIIPCETHYVFAN